MTSYEQKVREISGLVFVCDCKQSLIDFVQNTVDPLFDENGQLGIYLGSASYECSNLLEIYNPLIKKDYDILFRLDLALSDWMNDVERTNRLLRII